jgi:hypothetical protein
MERHFNTRTSQRLRVTARILIQLTTAPPAICLNVHADVRGGHGDAYR